MKPENGMLEAVILAAGNAVRMRPISGYIPKPCLPIGNKMILEHQIGYLKALKVEKVHIVVGYMHDEIRSLLGTGEKYSLTIEYHLQECRLGIGHALSLVRQKLRGPFILLLGDIYFQILNLQKMYDEFCQSSINGVLAASIEEDFSILKRNYSIELDHGGFVERVVEKPEIAVNNLKGAGAYILDNGIFSALENTPRSRVRNEVELTDAIQLYINSGAKLRCVLCVEGDENISTPSDLFRVNMAIIKQTGVRSILAEDHSLGKFVKLTNVVVGPGTVVEDGVSMENCVVLPNSRVKSGNNIVNSICYGMESENRFLELT